ncbi:MAG: adenosyl-hopene transferase HpnH [Sandaracinaceae bacterium]
MGIPVQQQLVLAKYLAKKKLTRERYFPLIVEIEPLFACNLECAGCGKIQYPPEILKQRLSVEQVLAAMEECGAPMCSIAGGEPLIHPEMHLMVQELLARDKIVFLCTNALLLEKKLDLYRPSPRFAWTIHIDGLRERHDATVCRDGTFDKAVAAVREAKRRGFRVTTNSTFFRSDTVEDVRRVLDYLNDELGVDAMMISPGFAYEKAPRPDEFLTVAESRALFRAAMADGRRERWRLNHSPLFLDFLEGKTDLECTPWAIPSYSIFGWQKPCYLMGEGYVSTYRELVETTDWRAYGRGRDPRCANCMAHCGYEPTSVLAAMGSLREGVRAALGAL